MFQQNSLLKLFLFFGIVYTASYGIEVQERSEILKKDNTITNIPYSFKVDKFQGQTDILFDNLDLSAYKNSHLFLGYGLADRKENNCYYVDNPDNVNITTEFEIPFSLGNKSYAISKARMSYDNCKNLTLKYMGYVFDPLSYYEITTLKSNKLVKGKDFWVGLTKDSCDSQWINQYGLIQDLNPLSEKTCDPERLNIYIAANSSTWILDNKDNSHYCLLQIDSSNYMRPIKVCSPWWQIEQTFSVVQSRDLANLSNFYNVELPRTFDVCTDYTSSTMTEEEYDAFYNDKSNWTTYTCTEEYSTKAGSTCAENPIQEVCKVNNCKGMFLDRCIKQDEFSSNVKDYSKDFIVDSTGTASSQRTRYNIKTISYLCPPPRASLYDCSNFEQIEVFSAECPDSHCDDFYKCLTQNPDDSSVCESIKCEKKYGDPLYPKIEDGKVVGLYYTCSGVDQPLLNTNINRLSKTKSKCEEFNVIKEIEVEDDYCEALKPHRDYYIDAVISSPDIYSDKDNCVRLNNVDQTNNYELSYSSSNEFKTRIERISILDSLDTLNDQVEQSKIITVAADGSIMVGINHVSIDEKGIYFIDGLNVQNCSDYANLNAVASGFYKTGSYTNYCLIDKDAKKGWSLALKIPSGSDIKYSDSIWTTSSTTNQTIFSNKEKSDAFGLLNDTATVFKSDIFTTAALEAKLCIDRDGVFSCVVLNTNGKSLYDIFRSNTKLLTSSGLYELYSKIGKDSLRINEDRYEFGFNDGGVLRVGVLGFTNTQPDSYIGSGFNSYGYPGIYNSKTNAKSAYNIYLFVATNPNTYTVVSKDSATMQDLFNSYGVVTIGDSKKAEDSVKIRMIKESSSATPPADTEVKFSFFTEEYFARRIGVFDMNENLLSITRPISKFAICSKIPKRSDSLIGVPDYSNLKVSSLEPLNYNSDLIIRESHISYIPEDRTYNDIFYKEGHYCIAESKDGDIFAKFIDFADDDASDIYKIKYTCSANYDKNGNKLVSSIDLPTYTMYVYKNSKGTSGTVVDDCGEGDLNQFDIDISSSNYKIFNITDTESVNYLKDTFDSNHFNKIVDQTIISDQMNDYIGGLIDVNNLYEDKTLGSMDIFDIFKYNNKLYLVSTTQETENSCVFYANDLKKAGHDATSSVINNRCVIEYDLWDTKQSEDEVFEGAVDTVGFGNLSMKIDPYKEIVVFENYLDGDFGYFSNHFNPMFKENDIKIDRRTVYPISSFDSDLYTKAYLDANRSVFQKRIIKRGHIFNSLASYASESAIAQKLIALSVYSAAYIIDLFYGKDRKEQMQYNIDVTVNEPRHFDNIYGYDNRALLGDNLYRYYNLKYDTGINKRSFVENMISGAHKDTYHATKDMIDIDIPYHDSEKKFVIDFRDLKWYQIGPKTSTGSYTYNDKVVKKYQTLYLGAVNNVVIYVPFAGDYQVMALDKDYNILGNFIAYEGNFIETSDKLPYQQVAFATAKNFNLADNVTDGNTENACRYSKVVEWGGGVSGAYYSFGTPEGYMSCNKSNDSYVQAHSAKYLVIGVLNSNKYFMVKLVKPMPFANNFYLVTSKQLEKRKYRCYDDATCSPTK